MLVLNRCRWEKIMIGPDMVIQVLEIRPGKVRLGIIAPRGIAVDREEIREAKERDGRKERDSAD